jgi:hypothetical protein
MNEPPASVSESMAQTPATSTTSPLTSPEIKRIFDDAFKSYKVKTGKDLKDHELFKELKGCDNDPTAILAKFRATHFYDPSWAGSDEDFDEEHQQCLKNKQKSNERLKKWLVPTLHVLCAFSNTLGGGVGVVFADSFLRKWAHSHVNIDRHIPPPKQSLLA